jgi:tight adherence protein B
VSASASAVAFVAATAGAGGFLELAASLSRGTANRHRALARGAATFVDALVRLHREGRDPGASERLRLLLAGAALALVAGAAAFGPLAGAGLAAVGPPGVARALGARRQRYRRAVDEGAAELAVAVADALRGGHSLRGGLAEAARALGGPAGHELRLTAAELRAGAATESALDALRARVGSPRVDTVVAACLLQRRAGGDLARLLRDCARAFEDQSRVEDEVRAATAQARFTGLLVVVLPLGGALLAELASPGFLAGLWSTFLTAWLVGIAILLQVLAAVLIRRLGRVTW